MSALSVPSSDSKTNLPIISPRSPTYDPRAEGANCDACPLKGHIVVPPTIPTTSTPDFIAVAMEPGLEEERKKEGLVGPSGRKFNQMLEKHGLDRSKIHITNATLCRALTDDQRLPALKCCSPRLQKEINSYPKTVPVVTMGAEAFHAGYGKKIRVTLVRGFVFEKEGREFLPTIHPAFVLRDHVQAPLFSRDFRRIALRVKQGTIELDCPKNFMVPRKLDELKRILSKMNKETVSCDIETTEESPTICELQCIGISDLKNTIVIPWSPKFTKVLDAFFKSRKVVFHNGYAFDTIVLRRYNIDIPSENLEDSLISHHVFASHFPQRMDHLVSFYLDSEPWKIRFGKRKGDEKGVAKKLSEDDLLRYNSYDAYLEIKLWNEMQSDLAAWKQLYEEDKELAIMCRDMQEKGILIDQVLKNDLSKAISEKEKRLFNEMKEIAGRDFSPTNPGHLREIIYRQFGAPVIHRTKKTLQPSTSKIALQDFAVLRDRPYSAFCKKMIESKSCSKMRVTYLDNLSVEPDGRVRASWRSFGTPTGRLACRSPNLQNLTTSGVKEPEQRIREIYRAAPGHTFVSFDLSQVEPRIAAYISGDKNMINNIESQDFHTENAKILFGNLPQLMDPVRAKKGDGAPMRKAAKSAGLAVNYLAGADKLHSKLNEDFPIKFATVVQMLESLHKVYAGYYKYVDSNIEFVRKHGWLKIGYLSGRIRYLGHAPEPSKVANSPIQSGAADVMNRLLQRIRKRIPKWLVAQVHDSGVFEVPNARVEEMRAIIIEEADKTVHINGYDVKFPIEMKIGQRLSEV